MSIIDDILYEPITKQQNTPEKWIVWGITPRESYMVRCHHKRYLPRFLTFKEASDICNNLMSTNIGMTYIPKLYDSQEVVSFRNRIIFFIKNITLNCIVSVYHTYDQAFDEVERLSNHQYEYGVGYTP